jgi:hypothetical protein
MCARRAGSPEQESESDAAESRREAVLGRKMEAAGIEPASADAPDRASTRLGCTLL